ncbi:MAG: hypothetical protein WC747_03245 [Candidatus Babeliales bacterium]|jgi:hypothetical protein
MKTLYKILLVAALVAIAVFTVRQMKALSFGIGGDRGGVGVSVGDGYYGDDYYDGYYNRPYRRGWFGRDRGYYGHGYRGGYWR